MTSDDTDAKTRELVEKEGRYGMAEGQIIIVMQDKVCEEMKGLFVCLFLCGRTCDDS